MALTRDSVAAADDAESHDRTQSFASASPLISALQQVQPGYLPLIHGDKATWIVRTSRRGEAVAVVAQQWDLPCLLVGPTTTVGAVGDRLHFEYRAQEDPDDLVVQLRTPRLMLMDTGLLSASPAERDSLWRVVVDLAVRGEGAETFTIDTTTEPKGQSVPERLGELGSGEHPIASYRDELAQAGPRVLELNLFAPDGWVAGIADWGDGVAVLFGEVSSRVYRNELTRHGLDAGTDTAEALDRPPAPVSMGE